MHNLSARIKTKYSSPTLRCFQQAKEQVDSRRFARSIESEKPKDDASRHLQGEIIDRFDEAKGAGKVFDLKNRGRHTAPFRAHPQGSS